MRVTCEAIIKAAVAIEVEEEDRFDTWIGDAESAEAKGMRDCRGDLSLWKRAADLEKAHETRCIYCLDVLLGTF